MKTKITDIAALSAVTPIALRAFATFEGWKKSGLYGSHGVVYEFDGLPELILPASDAVQDYAYVVSKALETFSQQSGRDETSVYRDLVHADSDVIRIRAFEAEDDGSVPVEIGVDLVSSARDVIAAAACSARDARRSYHPRKIQQVNEYLSKVRLGQTEIGSFVITLVVPVAPVLDGMQTALWPELALEPYERQVTRTLAGGLGAVERALSAVNRGSGLDAFESAVTEGVSANLCDAIAAISRGGDGAEVSVTWSRARPAPIPASRAKFSRGAADILVEVARNFRLKEPRPDVTLLGYIPHLQRGRRQTHGTVKLLTMIDGHTHSVGVDLQSKDYDRAIEAHRRKLGVTVTGDLVRDGQRWKLVYVRDLSLVFNEASGEQGES